MLPFIYQCPISDLYITTIKLVILKLNRGVKDTNRLSSKIAVSNKDMIDLIIDPNIEKQQIKEEPLMF